MEDLPSMELINRLPPEILPNIFKFLPLKDRKNVRLTCQLWYDACIRFDIIKYEKCMFRPSDIACENDVNMIMNAMSCRKRFPTEFQFRWIDLTLVPEFIWKQCGPHLETLIFFDCFNFTAKIMEKIIVHCTRLNYLHVSTKELLKIDSLFLNKVIDDLIDRNVVRRSLSTLVLQFGTDDKDIPQDETYRRLFRLYPNICLFYGDRLSKELTECLFGEEFVSSSAKLNFESWLCSSYKFKSSLSENSKLKFFQFSADFHIEKDMKVRYIKHFIMRHPEMKRIKLQLTGTYKQEEAKELLFTILRPDSKRLFLDFHSLCVFSNEEEFKAFLLASRCLNRLRLVHFSIKDVDTSQLLFPEIKYSNLQELELSSCAVEFSLQLIDRCPNLNYLSLTRSQITGKILMKILTKLTTLTSLRLSGFVDESDTRYPLFADSPNLTDKSRSQFRQLRGLDSLTIVCGSYVRLNVDNVLYNIPEIVSQLDLSNLTICQIEFTSFNDKWDLPELLGVLSNNAPFLREILVYSQSLANDWRSDQCFSQLKKFKKLKHITFPQLDSGARMSEWAFESERSLLKDLFIECSFLKCFIVDHVGAFFYNRVSETLVFKAE